MIVRFELVIVQIAPGDCFLIRRGLFFELVYLFTMSLLIMRRVN